MTDVAEELAVQSYCFRGFKTNEEVIERVKECGLSRIELCGAHVDFADPTTFDDVVNLYRQAGVEIVAVGVQSFANNEAEESGYFEFARLAGARFMSVSFDVNSVPDSYRTAERLAEKYDVRLAIHNHGGRDWLGSAAMLENVFANTNERIGLCLDTAWALDSGEDPIGMARRFGDRLYGLHIKDFIFDRARKPEDVVVGAGNLDLAALREALEEVGFDGWAALEYEGDVDNPVPALRECAAAVRTEWQS